MEHVTHFIDSDEFSGVELYCNRSTIAQFYLAGNGIEIGALHKPLQVPSNRCHVQYVDYKHYDENRASYPELANETIVQTDIIDNGFVLETVPDQSQDFIIANHALEHSPDPYGTLLNWISKLRPGGIVYAAIPIAEKCYDKGRPVTSLQHLVDDYDFFSSSDKNAILDVTKDHVWEFICISDRNIRESMGLEPSTREHQLDMCNNLVNGLKEELLRSKSYRELIDAHVHSINKLYDVHYHTFTPRSYETFLRYFTDQSGSVLENVIKNGNGECIGILRKN
jgi:SAM-dependent methyltransferase